MALNAKNRKKAEQLIYDTLNKLDPSGLNTEKYKAKFKAMSDSQFLAYFKKIKDDDNMHLYIETDLYGKNQINMRSCRAALAFLKVPEEEYVYMRHKSPDGTPTRSKVKVPVLYLHLKRMQQLLSKKNKYNVNINSGNVRSRITGGLNASNKSGRLTDA
jgi:hypothetical protein